MRSEGDNDNKANLLSSLLKLTIYAAINKHFFFLWQKIIQPN